MLSVIHADGRREAISEMMRDRRVARVFLCAAVAAGFVVAVIITTAEEKAAVLTGKAAMGDWTTDAPGVRRKITTADLPAPYSTPSVDNGPRMVRRPEGAWPKVPAGFKVDAFKTGLDNPRAIMAAPNGDTFVAESDPGRSEERRVGKECRSRWSPYP